MKRIVKTGGGTAGHLGPALAVARRLEGRAEKEHAGDAQNGTEILYIGCKDGIEATKLPASGIEHELIQAKGFHRSIGTHLITTALDNVAGFRRAREILRNFSPDTVFATGGYVSAPVLFAARTLGIPYVIHEQNAVPGLTVKMFGKSAYSVCISLRSSEKNFRGMRTVLTGCPIGSELEHAFYGVGQQVEENTPTARDLSKLTLLIFGGSQGAKKINETVLSMLEELASGRLELIPIRIVHACGTRDFSYMREYLDKKLDLEMLRSRNVEYELLDYIEDMERYYREANLVLSRSGAATVAEIIASAKPAILVPYPHATNDHQTKNAMILRAAGAATVIPDRDLNAHLLTATINALASEPKQLAAWSTKLRNLQTPNAGEAVADIVLQAAGIRGRSDTRDEGGLS